MVNSDDVKETYKDLSHVIQEVNSKGKLIILGDFNSRVDYSSWQNVLGHHEAGKCNSNGLMLLSLCTLHELPITKMIFQQADKLKNTRISLIKAVAHAGLRYSEPWRSHHALHERSRLLVQSSPTPEQSEHTDSLEKRRRLGTTPLLSSSARKHRKFRNLCPTLSRSTTPWKRNGRPYERLSTVPQLLPLERGGNSVPLP